METIYVYLLFLSIVADPGSLDILNPDIGATDVPIAIRVEHTHIIQVAALNDVPDKLAQIDTALQSLHPVIKWKVVKVPSYILTRFEVQSGTVLPRASREPDDRPTQDMHTRKAPRQNRERGR